MTKKITSSGSSALNLSLRLLLLSFLVNAMAQQANNTNSSVIPDSNLRGSNERSNAPDIYWFILFMEVMLAITFAPLICCVLTVAGVHIHDEISNFLEARRRRLREVELANGGVVDVEENGLVDPVVFQDQEQNLMPPGVGIRFQHQEVALQQEIPAQLLPQDPLQIIIEANIQQPQEEAVRIFEGYGQQRVNPPYMLNFFQRTNNTHRVNPDNMNRELLGDYDADYDADNEDNPLEGDQNPLLRPGYGN